MSAYTSISGCVSEAVVVISGARTSARHRRTSRRYLTSKTLSTFTTVVHTMYTCNSNTPLDYAMHRCCSPANRSSPRSEQVSDANTVSYWRVTTIPTPPDLRTIAPTTRAQDTLVVSGAVAWGRRLPSEHAAIIGNVVKFRSLFFYC